MYTTNIGCRRRPNMHEDVPVYLPGAAEFSADPLLGNPRFTLEVLDEVDEMKRIMDNLYAEVKPEEPTKKREPGNWLMIYIAYCVSDHSTLTRFVEKSPQELWKCAGFKPKAGRPRGREHVPHYNSVSLRFAELEAPETVEAIVRAGNDVIRHARKHEPRIGRAIHVDATHYASPSRLHHACTDMAACEAAGKVGATKERPSADEIRKERQRENEQPEPHRTDKPEGLPSKTWIDEETGWRYFEIDGHLWCCEDVDASAKSYKNGKTWIGGLEMGGFDALCGGMMSDICFTAREHEHKHYAELMRGVRDALDGEYPEIVSGDRGLSIRRVFRFNTIRGIASVFPYRRAGQEKDRLERRCDAFDEHGVPRCKHCGGPGEQHGAGLGLTPRDGRFREIRFRCRLGLTPDCIVRLQSVDCSLDWSMLVPLSRLTETYQAMHNSQKNREGAWHARRERWVVAGIDLTGRLKRKGAGVHRLRNGVARLLEWFFICLRNGWMGDHPYRNAARPLKRDGKQGVWSVMWARETYATDLPYGTAAQALGLSDAELKRVQLEEAKKRKRDGRGRLARRRERPRPLPRGARKKANVLRT